MMKKKLHVNLKQKPKQKQTQKQKQKQKPEKNISIEADSSESAAKIQKKLNTAPVSFNINTRENEVSLIVASSTGRDMEYEIKFTNSDEGPKLECDCGDQFNVFPRRTNCKHISGIINSLLKMFINSHKSGNKVTEKQLSDLFQELLNFS